MEETNVHIVPTSHVSEESVEKVKNTIDEKEPDLVAIELDINRLNTLNEKTLDNYDEKSVIDILMQENNNGFSGKMFNMIFYLLQSKVADRVGVDFAGLEFKSAYDIADEKDIPVSCVDKSIDDIMEEFSNEVSIVEMVKTLSSFLVSYVYINISSEDINEQIDVSDDEEIEKYLDVFEEHFPKFKEIFIDRRNIHMSDKVKQLSGEFNNIVLVVGAFHKVGIDDILSEHQSINVSIV